MNSCIFVLKKIYFWILFSNCENLFFDINQEKPLKKKKKKKQVLIYLFILT